jgi:Bifunctional DNA primase/polymerase, N-terminal
MIDTVRRRGRRRAVERMAGAAAGYAAMGWPVCAGAHPPGRPERGAGTSRACSCDRMGCPAPGAHPMSPAWQVEATADLTTVEGLWLARPDANVILPTGRVFDVLDVPAAAGTAALDLMERSGVRPGPVALSAGDRALFFVLTRGTPEDEHEWWSCHLDCEPETVTEVTGLRWHCRDSYVLAPPSRYGPASTALWLRGPGEHPLPDGVRLLEFLADACEGAAG